MASSSGVTGSAGVSAPPPSGSVWAVTSLYVLITYVFFVPFSAVTVMYVLLSPGSILVPVTEILASGLLAVALTTSFATSPPTVMVYSVTSLENAGDKVPGLTFNDER